MLNHVVREVYGPFHRKLAPDVQDAATVVKQIASGEIWGRPPNWGGSPAVKAYQGELPEGQSGIEFWSFQAPDTPFGPRAYWRTAGAALSSGTSSELVILQVAFVSITQDLHILVS